MMRVLQLVKTSTGAVWALRQMRELVANGVDVHVALPFGGPLVEKYQAAGVITHDLQTDIAAYKPWQYYQLFQNVNNLVRQVSPDVIHSHFVGSTLTMRWALRWRSAIPRLFQVPGPLHLEHVTSRLAELVSAGASDYWIGTCQQTCQLYRQAGVAPRRLFLSYYGTDLHQFVPGQPGQLRQELGVAAQTQLIGMVAYMYAPKRSLGQTRGLKGHEDLIDAVALLKQAGLNVKVVFAGGAWQGATAYERAVRAYGQEKCGSDAIFLGTRSDVQTLYADFDVAVHPSHSENVGGAVESLLLAVPTIASNVGGFPDLVQPGRTGWLVPPRQPAQLAETIREALTNPETASQLASRGQTLARQLFDVRETARQVDGIYHSVLGRNTP